MIDRRDAFKLTCLFAPLVAGVAALNAFGDGMNEFFTRFFAGSRYESSTRGAFRIISLRGASPDPAAKTLEDFTRALVEAYAGPLGLRAPEPRTQQITVYLLESKEDLTSQGLSVAHNDLENNGGFFAPAKLEIYLLAPKGAPADKGLMHEMTHALLHLAAPRAEWSAWLNEGLAGHFERSTLPKLGGWNGDDAKAMRSLLAANRFVPLTDLLHASGRDFSGPENDRYYLESRLLTDFLLEPERRERFMAYCREEIKEGAVAAGAFASIVGDPAEVERAWLAWLHNLR